MDSRLAEKLFRAYRVGLLSPRPSLEGRDQQFDVLFRQVFWSTTPLRERLSISKIWQSASMGLRLSREHRLDEAADSFGLCWAQFAKAELSARSALLALTFVESCHAYFEHKREAFDRARVRTFSSMEADLQLEADEDFSLLELHRIQSANNLMRIDLRAGEPRRALVLAGEILAYLEGVRAGLTIHHAWRSDLLWTRTPRAIRRALIAQVANEAVLAFAYCPGLGLEREFLANVGLDGFSQAPQALHPQFRLWLLTKQAFEQRAWDTYIERLLKFLPSGRTDIQSLWYSTVLDFLSFCRELDNRVSRYVHDGILREAQKWPGLPFALRSTLGLKMDGGARQGPVGQAAGFPAASYEAA